jgi:vacuolar-type H+-ATPase subunit I/STV1
MVGDIGYGLVILAFALVMKRKFSKYEWLQPLMNILIISSIPTIFFGYLYGEFFGDLPQRLFGIEPLCIERRTAIIPMLCFTASIGVVHVLLGLFLGALTALRRKEKEIIVEALRQSLLEILTVEEIDLKNAVKGKKPYTLLFLGFNGSGKTTSLAKVGNWLVKEGYSCVFAAADTFRAASLEQLEEVSSSSVCTCSSSSAVIPSLGNKRRQPSILNLPNLFVMQIPN